MSPGSGSRARYRAAMPALHEPVSQIIDQLLDTVYRGLDQLDSWCGPLNDLQGPSHVAKILANLPADLLPEREHRDLRRQGGDPPVTALCDLREIRAVLQSTRQHPQDRKS